MACVDGTAAPFVFGTSPEGVLRFKAKVQLGTQKGQLPELFTSAHDAAALSTSTGLGIGLTLNGAAIAALFPAGGEAAAPEIDSAERAAFAAELQAAAWEPCGVLQSCTYATTTVRSTQQKQGLRGRQCCPRRWHTAAHGRARLLDHAKAAAACGDPSGGRPLPSHALSPFEGSVSSSSNEEEESDDDDQVDEEATESSDSDDND